MVNTYKIMIDNKKSDIFKIRIRNLSVWLFYIYLKPLQEKLLPKTKQNKKKGKNLIQIYK